jgi:putative oxidoreductase
MADNSRFSDNIYALMRMVVGFLFACHGAQKLFGVLGGQQVLHGMMLTAGIVEFGGGVLIALGLLTRLAAFLASGEMASAYFMVHAKGGFFPIVNKGELAVLYCFVFLYITFYGAGRWGLDGAVFGSKAKSGGKF